MKKILSFLVCLCIICSMIPAFTVSAADGPQWVASFGADKAPGTLVDSYSFSDSDVPGRRVINSYTSSTNFSGEYTSDGFVLKSVSDFTSGTGGALSNE